ncbi:MAG: right-handed parallel beta-helix repeat-containing protein [Planctomycetota bacterium]
MSHAAPTDRSLALGVLAALALTASAAAGSTVNALDYGLRELPAGADATPALRRAVEACLEAGARTLVIPPGEWHLWPDLAFERTLAVANNDPGVKRIVLLLEGLRQFTVEAEGVGLVCHGQMIPISAEGCDGLTLKGLSINWRRPFNFQGEVVAVHASENAFDLRVHDDVAYEVRRDRLMFLGKPSRRPNAWREWAPPPTEELTWEHNLQWNMWFNGQTRRPIPSEHLWGLEPDPRVGEVGPRTIRLFDAMSQLPEVGWVVAVKGMVDPNRTSPAIRVARCSDVVLEDVTIHHAGGMGLIAQRTDGVTLRRYRVELPARAGRIVTTTADGSHFNGCRGDILLEDCLFENMLDDATNVHGCFVRVDARRGPNTFVCRRVHSQQRGLIVMETGDRVGFVNSDNLQPTGEATVVATRELNSDLFEVTFDRVPSELPERCGVYNLTWQPNLTVRNCLVRNHRARTMLVATAGDVLIEDNRFEYSSMAGIQFEGDNGFWWESGPTRSVLIRRNVFRDNIGSALRIAPQIDTERFPRAVYHGGIVFEDNLIEADHRRVVEATAVDGLVFRNNTIRPTGYLDEPVTSAPSFDIRSGRGVVIEGNRYEGTPPLTVRSSAGGDTPVLSGNEGIQLE